MRERGGPGDGARRKYRSAGRRFKEDELGPNQGVVEAVDRGMRRHHLLDRDEIDIAVASGAGEDERMCRRGERGIRGVQLQTRGTAEDAEVADAIVLGDSFKYEGGTRIKARSRSLVPVARVEPLRHESNPNQPLWWSAIAAP